MSKHTPGPWQVGTKHHHNACQVYAADGQDAVCMVYDIWHHRNVDECKDCKGMANAHLIAAAPELLEALKPFAELLKKHHDSMSDDRPIFAIEGSIITAVDLRKAVAAIAKAEGNQ